MGLNWNEVPCDRHRSLDSHQLSLLPDGGLRDVQRNFLDQIVNGFRLPFAG